MALPHLADVAGKRVLEVGCGRGAVCRWLADVGADVVGVDISSAAVKLARDLVPNAALSVADAAALPFPHVSFDVVISLETLEHVPNHRRALRELVRVTRPGGRILISTPNHLNQLHVYRALLRPSAGAMSRAVRSRVI